METVHEDWEVKAATQIGKTRQPIMHSNTITLEQLEFPTSFDVDFKASPKTECISFRYMMKNEKFCFQADFDSAFECYMCFHMMMRAGILHSQWSQIYNFELMDRLDFPHNRCSQFMAGPSTPRLVTAPVQETYPIAYPPTPEATLAVHEDFPSLQVAKPDGSEDDSEAETQLPEDNFSFLFAPSQPLASSKFSELGFPCGTPEVPCLIISTGPTFDVEDENVFMPLSFQEFGY